LIACATKKTSTKLVEKGAAVAQHGTALRAKTARASLEGGAVDELPVGLREKKTHQSLLTIVCLTKNQKARLAVSPIFILFSTN
jgi:hypothetical protein